MNPFTAVGRAAKKVVTAPVKGAVAVGNGAKSVGRFAIAQKRALDVWLHLEKAEADPSLYRSREWWMQLFKEVRELIAVLPLPKEIREMNAVRGALANQKTTLAGVALILGAVIAFANGAPLVDESVWMAAITGVGLILGKDFNVTGGTKPATAEAETRLVPSEKVVQ